MESYILHGSKKIGIETWRDLKKGGFFGLQVVKQTYFFAIVK